MTGSNKAADIYTALATSATEQHNKAQSASEKHTASQSADQPEAVDENTVAQQATTPGLFTQLGLYWQQLRQESLLQLRLFTLEAQLAAESLVAIWLLALWAGLMLMGAWLLLQLLVWQGLQALGLASWQGLLLLFLLQFFALLFCLRLIRYHSQFLRFAQTLASADKGPDPIPEQTGHKTTAVDGDKHHA